MIDLMLIAALAGCLAAAAAALGTAWRSKPRYRRRRDAASLAEPLPGWTPALSVLPAEHTEATVVSLEARRTRLEAR